MQFTYKKEFEDIDESTYFEEYGSLKFDNNSRIQMQIMMQKIFTKLELKDEYSAKKLEQMLKYELPPFTINRRLVKNWVIENFVY